MFMRNDYAFKRICAYIFDMLIVSLIIGLVTVFVPESDNSKKLSLEQEKNTNAFMNEEIKIKQFVNRSIEISYDQAKEDIPIVLINIVGMLGYFVVFHIYNNGHTIGKKLVKMKVTSDDGRNLSMNDYLKRCLLIPAIFFDLLNVILLMFTKKEIYLVSSVIFNSLEIILLIICGFMIIYRKDKRGLHDIIAGTKVVEVKGDVK